MCEPNKMSVQKKSNSKILKRIKACLSKEEHKHMLWWLGDKTKGEFQITLFHKTNPAWDEKWISFLEDLDSISPKKYCEYKLSPKYNSQCRVRLNNNLRKLVLDKAITLEKTKINKSTTIIKCKILNFKAEVRGGLLPESGSTQGQSMEDHNVPVATTVNQDNVAQVSIPVEISSEHSHCLCLSNQLLFSNNAALSGNPFGSVIQNGNVRVEDQAPLRDLKEWTGPNGLVLSSNDALSGNPFGSVIQNGNVRVEDQAPLRDLKEWTGPNGMACSILSSDETTNGTEEHLGNVKDNFLKKIVVYKCPDRTRMVFIGGDVITILPDGSVILNGNEVPYQLSDSRNSEGSVDPLQACSTFSIDETPNIAEEYSKNENVFYEGVVYLCPDGTRLLFIGGVAIKVEPDGCVTLNGTQVHNQPRDLRIGEGYVDPLQTFINNDALSDVPCENQNGDVAQEQGAIPAISPEEMLLLNNGVSIDGPCGSAIPYGNDDFEGKFFHNPMELELQPEPSNLKETVETVSIQRPEFMAALQSVQNSLHDLSPTRMELPEPDFSDNQCSPEQPALDENNDLDSSFYEEFLDFSIFNNMDVSSGIYGDGAIQKENAAQEQEATQEKYVMDVEDDDSSLPSPHLKSAANPFLTSTLTNFWEKN